VSGTSRVTKNASDKYSYMHAHTHKHTHTHTQLAAILDIVQW